MSKRKPSFLILTELFSPTKGGSAIWFDNVYSILGNGDSHVITSKTPDSDDFDKTYPSTIHRINFSRYSFLKPESLLLYLNLLLSGFLVTIRNNFHSIHAGRVLPEGLIAIILSKICGKPCLIYAHGEEITTWTQPNKQKFSKYVYKKADAVIANSSFTRDLLINLGVRPERIHLIHPGVDLNVFRANLDTGGLKNKHKLQGKKIIFSVGRLSRRKGFDQVIRAMPAVLRTEPSAHYVLGGIGRDEEYLHALIEEAGVAGNVTMLGKISDAELPYWYNACDLFIMPNRKVGEDTEGFGMVFIEAGACGKPVIAGKEGGTGDAVIDNVTGLRIDGDSVDDVSSAILRILGDKQLASRLAHNGLKRAREQFDWKRVAQRTRQILQKT